MLERDLLPVLLATLVAAPLLARLAGALVAKHLRAEPGQARRWMPSLPQTQPQEGTPAARFEAALRRAEPKAVQLLIAQAHNGHVSGVEAPALAAQLGVAGEVAAALLDDWRRRLPCRLRVTQKGRLLHDFAVADLQTAVRSAWHSLPQRALLFGAAVLANLGATWWVVAGVAVGAASLGAVWRAEEDEARLLAALGGIGALLAVFALSQAGAWLVRMVTWRRFPRMAPAEKPMEGDSEPLEPEEREEAPEPLPQGPPALVRRAMQQRQVAQRRPVAPRSAKSSGESAGWLGAASLDLDVDGEGCMALLTGLAVAVLASAVLGGLAVVGLWLRGLWLAVRRLGEPLRDLSPAAWLRQARRAATWERWVPTNDLAIRLVRALGRTLQGRPGDESMTRRVLSRARSQGGRVAALEIAIDHAVDPQEALSIGSRLVAQLDGDLQVSDAGDVDFVFPHAVLQGDAALPDGPEAEYLGANPQRPRHLQRLAVNVPGLTRDHVDGAARLAGGPLATVAVMALALLGGRGDLPIQGLDLSLGLLFCVLAPGTLMLAAATRQAVAESARQGVLRDVRRLAVRAAAATVPGQRLRAEDFAARLAVAVERLQLGWQAADLQREVERAWADLGIEPDLQGEAMADTAATLHGDAAEVRWSTRVFHDRLASLAALRAGEHALARADGDEVVFDSGEA